MQDNTADELTSLEHMNSIVPELEQNQSITSFFNISQHVNVKRSIYNQSG